MVKESKKNTSTIESTSSSLAFAGGTDIHTDFQN